MRSPFLIAQETGWYPQLLQPVIDEIPYNKATVDVLDVGTGPGKLAALIIEQKLDIAFTGIDINENYIALANQKAKHEGFTFQLQKPNESLVFANASFDVVTICSLLFLLDTPARNYLLDEMLRVLKPGGKLIVLTPSGKKNSITAFWEVWRYPFNPGNWTFILWKLFTSARARQWNKESWLEKQSENLNLDYAIKTVFNDNANLATLLKT
ncbi:MAG: class I SAM-dependent methyltransferase [Bacteroidetes bacterium]|nr:class I SAM-dependent methyltransferase [Bacteroidota bacterium]